MIRDDMVQRHLYQTGEVRFIEGGYNKHDSNNLNHSGGLYQRPRTSTDYTSNHIDIFDKDRIGRRTSSIATIEQLEAHLDSTDSSETKASNRALAAAVYIGLLTIIISFGKFIFYLLIYVNYVYNITYISSWSLNTVLRCIHSWDRLILAYRDREKMVAIFGW